MADEIGLTRDLVTDGQRTRQERRLVGGFAPKPVQVTAAPAGQLAAGSKVGRYGIVRLVGEGGMGTVYEAFDERLNRRVALKVLSPELKSKRKAAKRFAIEAQAAARLVHPNVVAIYDFDMSCDVPYMAMEYLEGETLASEIARAPLAFDRVADVMLAVCAGVYAAHQAGIVHRDLKPSNIFLGPDWKGHPTARVLDFGISKVVGLSSSGVTDTGDIVGTSHYLSPEQAAGARHLSAASDQYSLGVVMYEAVTQRTPQHGQPIHVLLQNVTQGRHDPPRVLRPELPAPLEAVMTRAMSLRPRDRFPSVYALGQALFPFASVDMQWQFRDYYRGGAQRSDAGQISGRLPHPGVADDSAGARPSGARLPAWRSKSTRTSARPGVGAARGDGLPAGAPALAAGRSRTAMYSVAVGALVAALTLMLVALWLRS
jgi:serine/threonine protein kinase